MSRFTPLFVVLGASLVAFAAHAAVPPSLDLCGPWQFQLDPSDQGVANQWFSRDLPQRINLPGSLQEQGFGNDVALDTPWVGGIVDQSYFNSPRYAPYREGGNIKYPCWLQPEKYYAGAAWYQRPIDVPNEWAGKRLVLSFERAHWETTVWIDDREVGSCNALAVPHVYELTEGLTSGRHRLTVRVDNRMIVNVGPNSHSVSDHTQSNWNGLTGKLELAATDPVWIEDVQVYPNVQDKTAGVVVEIGNVTGRSVDGTIEISAACEEQQVKPIAIEFTADGKTTAETAELAMGDDVRLWDEFRPALYRLSTRLVAAGFRDERIVTFGMRNIATKGTRFVLNGRRIALRGTLDCCIYPLTGYPPTDVAAWKRIIRICKAHGLNHIRFHSWCPPEAAFEAADELGFYYQVECSSWANQGASVGNGDPLDAWLYAEADRILKFYGNHPSLLLMTYGNEPSGPDRGGKYLGPWVTHYRNKDPRRLYTSAAGWPMIPENQYHNVPGPRIQQWGQGLESRINACPPETVTDYADFTSQYTVPVVSHEIGQWCVYPNFEEIGKYTGVLKPKNFEIFRDFLNQNHMGDQAHDFLMASGKLQTLCYKEEIESALRTPGFGGFQLLDLHDFPGQGTALVGVLDPFWDSKPYVSPDEFCRFCGPTVPLARLPKRVFTTNDTLNAHLDVYHYGPDDLDHATVTWQLVRTGGVAVAGGRLTAKTIPTGGLSPVGSVKADLHTLKNPERLRLVVGIEGTDIENDWDVWVYPAQVASREPDNVIIARDLDERTLSVLKSGGRVLLMLPPASVRAESVLGFSSVFWNTAWTRNQPPHTLGILCDPAHPALDGFPTEYHTNWQWWELIHGAAAMTLDGLPPGLRPIVQPIDTWFEARRLGLLFEARVGGGRLMVCSMDLQNDLESRPVARQLRQSLLGYMGSKAFEPAVDVEVETIRALSRPLSRLQQLGVTVTADDFQPGYPVENAIDGDPKTIWHTTWGEDAARYPHSIVLDLKTSCPILGFTYLPRQDQSNGRIGQFEIHVGNDGEHWGEPVAAGTWTDDRNLKTVRFATSQDARYIKLEAIQEVDNQVFASAAEVDVLFDENP
ncbi:MAG: glycoside hydrolase [Planctomycetaceae bacterium]|nr:glycoside hydrolase [Planctomycetaceae bacterium]